MKKKFGLLLVLVLLLSSVLAASPALAEQEHGRLEGLIAALDAGAGTITVQPQHGDAKVALTSADTEFFRKVPGVGQEPITFGDLAVDDPPGGRFLQLCLGQGLVVPLTDRSAGNHRPAINVLPVWRRQGEDR